MIDESPSMAQQPLRGQWLPIIEASRSHSAGNLWTSEQPDADTATWQHTTLTKDRYQCSRRDSNPQSQQASGRIHDTVTTSLWKSNYTSIIPFMNNHRSCDTVNNKNFLRQLQCIRQIALLFLLPVFMFRIYEARERRIYFYNRGHADIYFNCKRTFKKIEFSITNFSEGKEWFLLTIFKNHHRRSTIQDFQYN